MPYSAPESKKHSALKSKVPSPENPAPDTSTASISAQQLPHLVQDWLLDGECRLQSPRTIESKRNFLKNFVWFIEHRSYTTCGVPEVRAFFAYLARGHKDPGGRWGNARLKEPVRPITVKDYYVCLRTFFDWLITEEVIEFNPVKRIPAPVARTDHKHPLTPEQVNAILQAARQGNHPRRDEAIILFLLDTGVRSSELATMRLKDLDLGGRRCTVLGKGNKYRTVFFGRNTAKVLSTYLRGAVRQADDPVFLSERGSKIKERLTRSGLQQMIRKHGETAGIQAKVSPHWFRRTFAVEILKNGANVFSLREMLGHTNLQMTQKYLLLAQADVEAQHRQFSPADRLQEKVSR